LSPQCELGYIVPGSFFIYNYYIMEKKSFTETERRCENSFTETGPWWHLYTPGVTTPVFLIEEDDFVFVMNLMARCCWENPSVVVVSFEWMNNHVHVVLAGQKESVEQLFAMLRRRLARYLTVKGRELPSQFELCLKPIPDLKALRNTIAYTHRNGYVINPDYTPFTYPWSTGKYYYGYPNPGCPRSITTRESRSMFSGRVTGIPSEMIITNGHVAPVSFCAISLGKSMFRDAHHYFNSVSKNVESYSELAAELDDGEFLTDSELFARILSILKEKYRGLSLKELSRAQKLDLARILHFEYRSSNGQIRRLLNLPLADIDYLFPKPR